MSMHVLIGPGSHSTVTWSILSDRTDGSLASVPLGKPSFGLAGRTLPLRSGPECTAGHRIVRSAAEGALLPTRRACAGIDRAPPQPERHARASSGTVTLDVACSGEAGQVGARHFEARTELRKEALRSSCREAHDHSPGLQPQARTNRGICLAAAGEVLTQTNRLRYGDLSHFNRRNVP